MGALVLVDASGSMAPRWEAAREAVGDAFARHPGATLALADHTGVYVTKSLLSEAKFAGTLTDFRSAEAVTSLYSPVIYIHDNETPGKIPTAWQNVIV